MKLQPVSADLVIKLALGLALVGAVVYLAKKVSGAAGAAVDGATAAAGAAYDYAADTLYAVSPLNNENVIYQTANVGVSKVTGNTTDTLGTWWYGVWNDPVKTPSKPYTEPKTIGNIGNTDGIDYSQF